jgi:hypothetical protein
MKIYYRYIVEYDFRRVGYESATFGGWSLTPFDRSETPLDGFYEYFEYDLGDLFTLEEAIALGNELESVFNKGITKFLEEKVKEKEIELRKQKLLNKYS